MMGTLEVCIRTFSGFRLLTSWNWWGLLQWCRRRILPIGRVLIFCLCSGKKRHRRFVVVVDFLGGRCCIYGAMSLQIQIDCRAFLNIWGSVRVVAENPVWVWRIKHGRDFLTVCIREWNLDSRIRSHIWMLWCWEVGCYRFVRFSRCGQDMPFLCACVFELKIVRCIFNFRG